MDRIDKTLKKIAEDTSKVNSQTSLNTEDVSLDSSDSRPVCPFCGGSGFVRVELPVDHPDFGKLQLCTCKQSSLTYDKNQKLFKLSNLDAFSNMTFESFDPSGRVGIGDNQISSLKFAYQQTNQYAKDLNGWILLMGEYGCGKTHLAAAVANCAVSNGVETMFLTVPDLLDWLRSSYNNSATPYTERFNELRNIKLLVLDDLGTQNATSWAKEKLFQILNHRYINRLPTVITTNLTLMDIEDRIRSRLSDPELVTRIKITAPDYRSPFMDTSHPKLSSLNLLESRTFGNFSLRGHEKIDQMEKKSVEKAFRASQKFAEQPQGWLILLGKSGTGKTHLAAAIGNYRYAMGDSPMFVVVIDLLDHLRATFSPNSSISYDHAFREIQTSDLLILDDLSTKSATPWAREKLYQILNYRYNAELPTVITSTSTIYDIDPQIRTRMLDKRLCDIFAIDVPSYLILPGDKSRSTGTKNRNPTKN